MSEHINEEWIEVQWTSGSLDEARRVSRFLVQERIVACAQIIPWIESVYMWDNQLETSQESKIILKSKLVNYEKIRQVIEQNCQYEVPEITWIKISGGNEAYLKWMKESTFSLSSHDEMP